MNNSLVLLSNQAPNLQLEIKYATTDNFTGQKLYKKPLAYLHKDVLPDFIAACKDFERLGFGVKVWDAYRPLSVTQTMWDVTPDNKKQYVADPAKGSMHNRGCAIDMTLYDLATNQELVMPTEFDDFTEKAHAKANILDARVAKNRDLLIEVMTKHNFEVHPNEWWHFNRHRFDNYTLFTDTF